MNHLETVRFLGRTHILIDFDRKTKQQYQANWSVVDPHLANGWRSVSRFDRDLHLPCFDVDLLPTKIVANLPNHITGKLEHTTAADKVREHFPDAEWVPSSTDGHFHVYSDTPLTWGEYESKLGQMTNYCIVEAGYYNSAMARLGTHVRKPGVLKEPLEPVDPMREIWQKEILFQSMPILRFDQFAVKQPLDLGKVTMNYKEAQNQLKVFHERYSGLADVCKGKTPS
jgi:hypothetical protein